MPCARWSTSRTSVPRRYGARARRSWLVTSWSMTTPSERRSVPAPPISVIRFAPGSSKLRFTSRTRPSGPGSRPLSTCRRSPPGRIPRATRRRDHWIAERVFDWSGVPVVHLRPTFFAQWLLYRRSRATIVEDGVIDLPYGEGRHAPIAAEDQARLIAAILAQPAAHLGKTYPLHGAIELDQAGIAAAVSEVLGRTISYRPLTSRSIGSVWRRRACRSL